MADIELVIKVPEELYKNKKGYLTTMDAHIICDAVANGTPLPKGHGRLIDADALADKLREVSVIQKYEDVKIDHRCTVADVLTSLTYDLKGIALCGYELCPTIIEAE